MKYVIFNIAGEESPIIFSSWLKHSDVAEAVIKKFSLTPVSAGFIRAKRDGTVVCTGDSMTLRIASRSVDTDIVNEALGLTI